MNHSHIGITLAPGYCTLGAHDSSEVMPAVIMKGNSQIEWDYTLICLPHFNSARQNQYSLSPLMDLSVVIDHQVENGENYAGIFRN